MLLVLCKLICIILGLLLSADFTYKGLKSKDMYLFYEGLSVLLITGLFTLVAFI